jgi:hypothetical protein
MRRIGLAVVLALSVLAPLAAEAQQARKVPQIGYLAVLPRSAPLFQQNRQAFLDGMREHGYTEGQTIAIEWRFAEGRPSGFPTSPTNWSVSRSISSLRRPRQHPGPPSKRLGLSPCLHRCCRSGYGRARRQPCAAGWQCHGVVLPEPGVDGQTPAASEGGRPWDDPRRGSLAA